MKKLTFILLAVLPMSAWARPETNLEELRAIDRRGQTWKTSATAPRDNARWLEDVQASQFVLEKTKLLNGQWLTGLKPGTARYRLAPGYADHILRLEIEASASQGSLGLEVDHQELLTYVVDPSQTGQQKAVQQKVNVSLSRGGELCWNLAPNTTMKLRRVRIYQLR